MTGRPGSITDVPGIRVGQAERVGDGWLTGITVVLPPPEGAVAGVDVRGGGPGDPRDRPARPAQRGRAGARGRAHRRLRPGLAAVDGVVQRLLDAGVGFPVGGPGEVVPIVPAAVIFDLGRGGTFAPPPDARARCRGVRRGRGRRARGRPRRRHRRPRGRAQGRRRHRSARLADGTDIGALVVVNAVGSAVDPATGELYAARHCAPGDLPALRRPDPGDLEQARAAAAAGPSGPVPAPLATTLVVLATDATLTKAQCQKVSGIGHDGLARAIDPVHTMLDGDTVFTLATVWPAGPGPARLPRPARGRRRLRHPRRRPRRPRRRVDPRPAELPGGLRLSLHLSHTPRALPALPGRCSGLGCAGTPGEPGIPAPPSRPPATCAECVRHDRTGAGPPAATRRRDERLYLGRDGGCGDRARGRRGARVGGTHVPGARPPLRAGLRGGPRAGLQVRRTPSRSTASGSGPRPARRSRRR